MKIDRPKISPELSSKNFQDIFYEEIQHWKCVKL